MSGAPQAADPLVGHVLDGRYAIEGRLGEGGLGVVYRATQTRLGRKVAVKVLAEHARTDALRARFEREARSLGNLIHPNIVQVIDFGIGEDDAPFIVMELLEGRPLNEAVRAGIELERAFEIGLAIVRAVAYAHARRIVHRDLKPANVFLQRAPKGEEIPRVLDFGLAKFLDQEGDAAALTKAGVILGTPSYMSPEQASGAPSDARADVYSLGIVLFELLAGVRPFRGAPADLLRMHLFTEMPTLESARPGIPHGSELDAILRRATAKPPRDRYADAGELLAALETVPPLGSRGVERRAGVSDFTLDATVVATPAKRAERPTPPAGGVPPTIGVEETAWVATQAPATPSGPERRRPSPLLLAGLAVLAVGAVGGLVALGVLAPADTPEATTSPEGPRAAEGTELAEAVEAAENPPPPEPRGDLAAVEPSGASTPPEPRVEVARVEPSQPPPLPPELAEVARGLEPGDRMSFRDRRQLNRWSRAHPEDPRAWLLMAHADFENGARTDALTWYENAVYANVAATRDPVLRRDLVIMAGHRKVGSRAQAMVRSLFGADAPAEIEAALREERLDPDERRQIEAFRASFR